MDILFITGPPRSGTTLVSGLIQGEKTYPMLPECTYLSRVISLCHEIKTYPDKTRYPSYIKDDERLYRLFQPTVEAMIHNVITDFEKKDMLILKDPELSTILDVLPKLISYPFKIVACIRDPRDVVASWMNAIKKKGVPADFAEELSVLFKYYYGLMQAESALSSDMFQVFRYEDILTLGGAQSLEAFTGCQVNMDDPFKNVSFDIDKDDPFYSPNYGNKITTSSLRRFEKELSTHQIGQVEEMFAGIMAWGSYE